MNLVIIALILVGIVEAAALVVVARGLRRMAHVDSRLGHLTDALTLLSETTEAGFRANAAEIERVAERSGATSAGASGLVARRITTASRRGRPAAEIAAEERIAEGEVNLRLHLAKSAAARRLRTGRGQEASHGALLS
jgi:hypothetical protein